MAKVLVNESSLTGIADAIRGKNGKTDTYKPSEMAAAITAITTGGGSREDYVPDSALVISGKCDYKFSNSNWDWFVEKYGNQMTTNNISSAINMFYNSNIETIPFDLNFDNSKTRISAAYLFSNCDNLKQIGNITNLRTNSYSNLFNSCLKLRYLPEFINFFNDGMGVINNSYMFVNCYSLRSIPEELLTKLTYNNSNYAFYSPYYTGFESCYSLDEIRGLNVQTGTLTSNAFNRTFEDCNRVKDVIFATQEDGTPYTANWKSQTINLASAVGWASSTGAILNYNSGITADKEVKDDTTYATLKNDADWFTVDVAYSRYNHDSAVNTINSLPDTSAYLAANGGTNTIKFKGESGSATDGGAINTLTAEEIAVATAKGWTVSLV